MKRERAIKNNINKIVESKIGKENNSKIVVFVDDLDRLLPEKAVELLEIFKLFLDIPGCVYVLACDYQVIAQGLKKKFGIGSDDLKGKSFFDKIIQLPFQMPVSQYDVEKYINALLTKIKIKFEQEDIKQYKNLINNSVGFNPRTLKRLFNSLLLLNMVAEKQGLLLEDTAKRHEKQKVIFGTLCLQMAYEPLYGYLQKNKDEISQELFDILMEENKFKNDEKFKDIRDELEASAGVDLNKLAGFMKTLHESLQLMSDNDSKKLSPEEISNFIKMLSFSSLTSTGTTSEAASEMDWDERYANREMAKEFIEELRSKYAKDISDLNSSFKIYQSRSSSDVEIYADIKLTEDRAFQLDLYFAKEFYGFCFYGKKDSVIYIHNWAKDNNVPADVDKEDAQRIWHWKKSVIKPTERDDLIKQFKEETTKTLDILFPKLSESFSNLIER